MNPTPNPASKQSADEERSVDSKLPSSPYLSGFFMGRLGGIAIHVDWSLLIVFVLIAFNLGAQVFPHWHPDWSVALTWGVALAASVLFFASVLAHEMSHALIGRGQGIAIPRITLFLFGGMAHMQGEPRSPKAEFWMAIVGPVTSLAIGIGATLLGGALARDTLAQTLEHPEATLAGVAPVPTLLLWLGPINILLGLFNLVPGFPLDGGRVLRSVVWAATGDLKKATYWASNAGRVFAWFLMGIGILNLFGGALLQGLWLLLIGWFLSNAARASYQQLVVRQALENVPVTRVMRTQLRRIEPTTTLESVVRDIFLVSDQGGVPVESEGTLLGMITLSDLRRVPQDRWPDMPVSEVMTRVDQIPTLPPDARADQALSRLREEKTDQIPVVDHGHLLGLVASRDLIKWLSFRGVEAV